ncbi:efflux RND transporter permease subunit [Thiohalophilus thiocyanatoxydans]|uniref:Multidrug efflux pump n=1 Tax=Thiohalophilus thiocyanatoxydans TaxID=381308 RepID=A0A4R8III9_9GAMM|nr:efflux RND transporter permease subunit [Thiohalophilus thiocyanatoxydans]TDY00506.1 multidrug efflux pump [Thiohalophilus thiocyanatoxydans]
MKFTDTFIHRPVLATVVSLLILLIGLRSLGMLEVRQYPEMKNTVVTITTTYPGASSDLVKGFVTTPIQQAVAEANGIDYITSTSSQGQSTIEVYMELDYDPNAAVAEIQAKVASKRNELPADVEDPVIDSSTGDTTALMYVAFFSEDVARSQITDYVLRVTQPQIQALSGVAKARLFGEQFAMRIWLDPARMAAQGITAGQVAEVLRANNYLAGIGSTKGKYVAMNLTATTDVSEPDDFRKLVVRSENGTLVRLQDIARTELGAEDYNTTAWYKGIPAAFIAVEPAPGSNPIDVADRVNNLIPQIRDQLPDGVEVKIPYDASQFIKNSITEVYKTIAEAVLIVLVVIYLTLGSFRAAVIPAVAVPLSLIGAAFVMLTLGFSLNLLTLLSMVLAIGLVVDDAIIVVENVHRHIEEGESNLQAALKGARELAVPIIAMTTTLLAVYAPIGFLGGLVGSLFTEFAFALSGAVLISGVVALTLSPVLSSAVLKQHGSQGRFEQQVEKFFNWLSTRYRQTLTSSLNTVGISLLVGAVILASNYFMFANSKSELAPTEDQSILFFNGTGPRTATLDYHKAYSNQIKEIFEGFPEYNDSFFILGRTQDTVFGGFKMVPQDQRERSQMAIKPELGAKLNNVAGYQIGVFPRPSIPGSSRGLPVQFVITSDSGYEEMVNVANQIIGRGMESGNFQFLKKSIELDRPTVTIDVDRDRAADLGISMREVGTNLGTLLGGGYVNRFSMEGRSYKVIPQVEREFRLDATMLNNYYLQTATGEEIPLSSIASLKQEVEPSDRTQFQQLNSLIIEGNLAPGVTMGEALSYLESQADELLPRGFDYDYLGDSRQYASQSGALMLTFFLALLVIYLVLAAQFESWRDPIIILVSVPLSTAGALIFIMLGVADASINIYTQVGLITLIGVVAKNGILIVEFANKLQIQEGKNRFDAVVEAATIRLRPIIMTSIALIVAMIPLIAATGPGAVSRTHIGMTIAAGLGIGTLFTLFVLPAVYLLLARDHSAHTRQAA